jgi:hypothetical protein
MIAQNASEVNDESTRDSPELAQSNTSDLLLLFSIA